MHATFLIEFGLVVLGLGVLGRLGGAFGISPIPLYVLGGLALGEGGVIQISSSEFLGVGAQLGVVLLLLMLGLEFTSEEFTASLRRSAPAGVLDLVANFVPGMAAALVLGWTPMAAVFLGGVTYISSSGIISKLLEDLGWVANRETPVVLSILVIEDLAMVVYLPLVAALLLGSGGAAIAASVGVAVGVMGATLVAALRFGESLSKLIFSHSSEALVLTVIGLTVAVAGGAERLQASAAVGAFLVGIALSGHVAESARTLLRPVRDLFAAVFFLDFGMEISPSSIPPVLAAALVLALVTAVTKLGTGWWSAKQAGVGTFARRRAGAALIPRGEFSIVIAGIGSTAGVHAQLGPLAAAYVLILAIAGTLVARVTHAWVERDRLATRAADAV